VADDDQPTDELEGEGGGRARIGLADPPLIASGRRLGGRYVLNRVLGHGGMAVVWLAIDERLDREVAVKVLSDTLTAEHDYRGRFRREAHVAAGLQHPNLVSVYDYDAGDRPYLVMEYIEGGDLAAALDAGTRPPAHQVGRELLSALQHIHGAGILHRDIKPQNVLIDGHGYARLTDFGIARPSNAAQLTKTGHVIGTERYLSPEVRGGEPATERSDLFALGVLLAELGGEGPVLLLAERLRDPDPTQRPASAAAALAELERTTEAGPPGTATQPFSIEPEPRGPRRFEPTVTRPRSPQRRSRFVALAAVGLAILALAIALLAGGGGEGGDGRLAAGGGDKPEQSGGGSEGSPPAETSTGEQTTDEPSATEEPATTEDTGGTAAPASDDGFALNEQGFALIGEEDYAGAVPVLEKAVGLLRDSGDEQTYNYALYNLATAYLGVDRPEDAIPLLEERMQYEDQLDTVQRTLDEAEAAAGVESPATAKPPKEEKPGKGPKDGKVPPGHADDE
jgi:serine/threonine protein kinase